MLVAEHLERCYFSQSLGFISTWSFENIEGIIFVLKVVSHVTSKVVMKLLHIF